MSESSSQALFLGSNVKKIDRTIIEQQSIAGIVLMKRAGRAAFKYLLKQWPHTRRLVIVAGSGNNAGDAFIVAALAAQRGLSVAVLVLKPLGDFESEAKVAAQFMQQEAANSIEIVESLVALEKFLTTDKPVSTVIVDGLLGLGIKGALKPKYADVIHWVNSASYPVLALDVPSGLHPDTGYVSDCAIKADYTISFIALKQGLFTANAAQYCGTVIPDNLQINTDFLTHFEADAFLLDDKHCSYRFPKRRNDMHKHDFAHVLVVGGDYAYGGAALLAAQASLRVGGNLCSLATRQEHVSAALARIPEVMSFGVSSGQELEPWLVKPDIFVLGPGLGQSPWSEQLLMQVINQEKTTVFDADALNLIATGRFSPSRKAQAVFTPHPGEAARLLNTTSADIQADRFGAIRQLQKNFGGVFILKGPGTLIFDGRTMFVANVGNAYLATPGSGDVLSGIVGALLAHGLAPLEASALAVCLHGKAADLALERNGGLQLIASDILALIPEASCAFA